MKRARALRIVPFLAFATLVVGVLFASYLILAGTERLLVEFIRRNEHVWLGLTAAQIESIVMIVAGCLWLAWLRRARVETPRRPSGGGTAVEHVT